VNSHVLLAFFYSTTAAIYALGLVIYIKLFPHRKLNLVVLLIIISLLPLYSILRPGPYESGDMQLHATRAISFYNILFNEHKLPTWFPELNLGYGDA